MKNKIGKFQNMKNEIGKFLFCYMEYDKMIKITVFLYHVVQIFN